VASAPGFSRCSSPRVEVISELFPDLSTAGKFLLIVVLAVVTVVLARIIRAIGNWLLAPHGEGPQALLRTRPRYASLVTLALSGLTFVMYFATFGLILEELGIPLTAYLASASVVGLAIGFGSQGLVQDVVIGLTLIFSDVLNIGDVVDIGGQTGRVEVIGLRFTSLLTLQQQRVHVPNRNITQIVRYRKGHIRVLADIQIPHSTDDDAVTKVIEPITRAMFTQYGGLILTKPEMQGTRPADAEAWRFLRIQFRLWPGQAALVEGTFKQRALAAMRTLDANYADWMITVVFRSK
jgi:small-conductance mechanosensitive channel